MATLNSAATADNAGKKSDRSPTHYINLNVLDGEGKPVRIGAIPVFTDPDKAQRTLLHLLKTNPDRIDTLVFKIDIRENVKGTDTFDADEWLSATIVEVPDETATA